MNLVYINTHDTGRSISPYGYDTKTKNLSGFAEDATLFTNAFCCSPTCSPSRSSLLTGVYPHQNGMLGLAQRGFELSEPDKHIASYLKGKGYRTVISGVQHERGWYLDVNQGDEEVLGYEEVLTQESAEFNENRENLHLWDDKNVDKLCEWLDNYNDNKPFMMSYGLHSTHRPYPIYDESIKKDYVKPQYPSINNDANREDEARFIQSAINADNCIKKLLDSLKKNNCYENTVIIYTTDHGLALPYNKCCLKDSGIGVGLIIRNPKKNDNKVIDSLISQIDVFPTICDLLSIDKPSYLEGQSFVKVFEDKEYQTRETVFAEVNFHTSYEPMRCVRSERYKYIKYYDSDWTRFNLSNMDESSEKTLLMNAGMQDKDKEMECLYDTYYDPYETNNVIEEEEYQETLKYMRLKLDEIQIKTKDPLLNGALEFKSKYKVNKTTCIMASSKNKDDYI